VAPGMQLAFCTRDVEAARRDLVRICTEIRAEVEGDGDTPGRIAGALYASCTGRGGPHFGAPSAELQIVQHALGEVPLAGFFAAGEIAHRHLYGYTGVLTVFVDDGP
jgi:small ligand-binding sensory domain FIST